MTALPHAMHAMHAMHAISQDAFGGPEVLRAVETVRPDPGPGEVLVRVRAAGVNPADWRIRSGQVRRFGEPPFTLGLDLSGIVAAVGDGVTGLRPGDEVFGVSLPPHGSYAEFAVAPAGALAAKPPSLDHVQAAALPVAALTAYQALVHVARVGAGQRVLVHAATGGVGHLAVQIAKSRGAQVIGTARASGHALLRELGANELIDYTSTDFARELTGIDVVLDTVGGDYGPRSLDTLAPGALLIDVTGSTGSETHRALVREQVRARGLRFAAFSFTPSADDLDSIAALVEQGRLRAVLDRVLPLAQAAEAHRLSESGRTKGKIVLSLR